MQPKRILVPVDVRNCSLEVFDPVNTFARGPGVTIILLHVLHVSIVAPENRLYEELVQEAQERLQRLAERCIGGSSTTVIHVRMGKPAEQILAEAKAECADLIILPVFPPSFWERLTALWRPPTSPIFSPLAEKIARRASCEVYLAIANSKWNFQNS